MYYTALLFLASLVLLASATSLSTLAEKSAVFARSSNPGLCVDGGDPAACKTQISDSQSQAVKIWVICVPQGENSCQAVLICDKDGKIPDTNQENIFD
jgi:hypothetical protein